ncbi:MAG: hypothetical protein HQK84_06775 [Nitrospinae bacterium]|nr:hypothetical protein [Nitrospinota bacterium]
MEYSFFPTVTLIVALAMILYCLVLVLFPKASTRIIFSAFFPPKRPAWVIPLSFIVVLFIFFVWYKVFTGNTQFSWVIALFLSFSLVKSYYYVFYYEDFRNLASTILENQKNVTLASIGMFLLSGLLLMIWYFLY